MTPPKLARQIVQHFRPSGRILEPCCGTGNFLKAMPGAEWCEIRTGRDFFDERRRFDWIVTNPPWSQVRAFLRHALEIADNVVFLMTANHAFTKARIRDMEEAGFEIEEIYRVPTPKEFPQTGFQLAAVYYKRKDAPHD